MKSIISILIFILISFSIYAEGYKELSNNGSDDAWLDIKSELPGKKMATFNGPEYERLYIRIQNPASERVVFGFNKTNKNNDNFNYYFRIKDPNGVIVYPTVGNSTAGPTVGAGYIASEAQNLAGPQQLGNATGYNGLVYTPAAGAISGDYYIEFSEGPDTFYCSSPNILMKWFDITVAQRSTNTSYPGRVWSKAWSLGVFSPFLCKAKAYVYAIDSVITLLDMNGTSTGLFSIMCNSFGTNPDSLLSVSRKSRFGTFDAGTIVPEYKVFLNDPDPAIYKAAVKLPDITANPQITGCHKDGFCIQVNATKALTAKILLDLNGTVGYQAGTSDVLLEENLVQGNNCIAWDGKDGLGAYVKNGISIRLTTDVIAGFTNFPIYDMEGATNGIKVSIVRPAGFTPKLFWDDSQIQSRYDGSPYNAPATDGWTNFSGCTAAGGCHKWTNNRGENTPTDGFAASEIINTWWYTNLSTKFDGNITFNFTCPPDVKNDNVSCLQYIADTFDVMANDMPAGMVASISIFTAPKHGSATIVGNQIRYRSDSLYYGKDTLTYRVCYTSGTYCANAKMFIDVTSVPLLVVTNPTAVCQPNTVNITTSFQDRNPLIGTKSYWTDLACTNSLTTATAVTTSGTYYIKKTEGSLSTIKPVVVTIHITPNLSITTPSAVCEPSTINITSQFSDTKGTTGTVTYWTDAGASNSLSTPTAVTTTGTYYIKKTTSTTPACSDIEPIDVTVNLVPVLSITTPSAVCEPSTINITSQFSDTKGTTGTVTYWTDAGASNSLSTPTAVTSTGTYYIKKTTSTTPACSDIEPIDVTVNLVPVLSITTPSAVCEPSTINITSQFSDTKGTTGTVTYWTDAGASNSLTTPTAVTTTGTYYIKKTTSTTPACSDLDPINVTVNLVPVLSITTPSAVCEPSTINITSQFSDIKGTTGTVTYWTDAGASNSLLTPTAVTSTGTYYIKKTTFTTPACTDINPINVTVNPLPTLSLTLVGDSVCSGDTAILKIKNSQLGVDYLLRYNSNNNSVGSAKAGTGSDIIYKLLEPSSTTFNVLATNSATGCNSSLTQTVDLIQREMPDASGKWIKTLYNTDTILQVNVSKGFLPYSYIWSPVDSIVSGQALQKNPTTTKLKTTNLFGLTVTDAKGCKDTALTKVTVYGGVLTITGTTANALDTAYCAGDNVMLRAIGSGGSGIYTYTWTSIPPGYNTTGEMPILIPTETKQYVVEINDGFNTAKDTFTIKVNPLPVVSVKNDTIVCSNYAINLFATGGTKYNWSTSETTDKITVTPISTTIYTVTVTNVYLCSVSKQIAVTAKPSPSVNAGIDFNLLYAKDTTLNISVSGGSGSGYTYQWQPSNFIVNATDKDPKTTKLYANTTFNIEVSDVNGCKWNDDITITVYGNPLIVVIDTNGKSNGLNTDHEICVGESITLKAYATGGTGIYTYKWSLFQQSAILSTSIIFTDSPKNTTAYLVELSDGVSKAYDTIVVAVNPLPNAVAYIYKDDGDLIDKDTAIYENTNAQLGATGGVSYLWSSNTNATIDDVTSQTPFVFPLSKTRFIVTVTDLKGCKNTDTVLVKVGIFQIFVPQAFTPNEDGINDILYVRGFGIKEFEFKLYSRWGELLFETKDLEVGWDGTFKGKYQHPQTLGWVIKVTDLDGIKHDLKGNVTIFK